MTSLTVFWRFVGLPLIVLITGFLLLALGACAVANQALYHPDYGSRRAPEGLKKVRTADGNDIAVLHLPNPDARFTLWFFHGNAEDLGDLEPFLRALRDSGFAVFAFDYPGYGLSDGKPTEASLYAAARAARTYLREELRVPAERTLIYGRSLGGGPALEMARAERVGGVVLQSTFTSVFRVVTKRGVLPFDQFVNVKKVAHVKCPVLVLHGTADEVIPFTHGEELFALAAAPKRSLFVRGAQHNNLVEVSGRAYWEALRDFSELCARGGEVTSP